MSPISFQQLISDSRKCISSLSQNGSNQALWRALTGGLEQIADQTIERQNPTPEEIKQIKEVFAQTIQLSKDKGTKLESMIEQDLSRFEAAVQDT